MLKFVATITTFGAILCAQPSSQTAQPVSRSDGRVPGPMGRGPRAWWEGDLSKNANLSDAQQKQVLQIRKEFRPHMREVQDAVNKADAELAAVFNEEPVDQGKANDAINHLAAARAEATKTVSQFSLKLRSILTAQQWQDLQRPRPWPDRVGPRRHSPTSTSPTTTNQK